MLNLKTGWRKYLFIVIVALGVTLGFSGSTLAFDVGYHFDLTREALSEESYSSRSIDIVQIMNYYDDGFESAKTVMENSYVKFLGLADAWGAIYGPAELRDLSDTYMHFDALKDTSQVKSAWKNLIVGSHHAVKIAESNHDAHGLLAILGMTLHQVQDFYAHSNWADTDWKGDTTWFEVNQSQMGDINTTGNDKDYAGKPNFETAYREAFYASCQWVKLLKSWVDINLWNSAAAFYLSDTQAEKKMVTYLSWYAGHWKGPSSESGFDMAVLGATYLGKKECSSISKWREYCKFVCLTRKPTFIPACIVPIPEHRWIEVRTSQVYQYDDYFHDIDPGGEADFYAIISVNGNEYMEAMHLDGDNITPTNWLTLVPISSSVEDVVVSYNLWDEDITAASYGLSFRGNDDHCDIVPGKGSKTWTEQSSVNSFLSGKDIVTETGWFYHDGDGNEAAVHFSIKLLDTRRKPPDELSVILGAD